MQELEKILDEIDGYVRLYQTPPFWREVEGTVELFKRCGNIIRKHMNGKDADVAINDSWIPVEKFGLPKDEGVYDLTIIDGLGVYDSVRWQFLGGAHLSGTQHYVDGVHYWADNYRGDPINKFLSERVIAWRKKPEPYRSANKTEASGWREEMLMNDKLYYRFYRRKYGRSILNLSGKRQQG